MARVNSLLAGYSSGSVDLGELLIAPQQYTNFQHFAYATARNFGDGTMDGVGTNISSYSGVTATGWSYSSSSIATRQPAALYPSATTAGSSGGVTFGPPGRISTTAGVGGYRFRWRWCCADAATVAGARSYAGVYSGGNIGNVDISTLGMIFGFGSDPGDVDLSLYHNDGAGTATKETLPGGAGAWPANTLSDEIYEAMLEVLPGSTAVSWYIKRVSTGSVATGRTTSDVPDGVSEYMHVMRSNGATALSVRPALFGFVSGKVDLG